jgi:hypothetical protein
MTTEIKERIVKYSKELRLPTFRGEFEVHASEAAKQEASYEEYLLGLMEKEYYTRVENRKKSQIRQAGFPQKHYLHDLQKELLPDNARQKLLFSSLGHPSQIKSKSRTRYFCSSLLMMVFSIV